MEVIIYSLNKQHISFILLIFLSGRMYASQRFRVSERRRVFHRHNPRLLRHHREDQEEREGREFRRKLDILGEIRAGFFKAFFFA